MCRQLLEGHLTGDMVLVHKLLEHKADFSQVCTDVCFANAIGVLGTWESHTIEEFANDAAAHEGYRNDASFNFNIVLSHYA